SAQRIRLRYHQGMARIAVLLVLAGCSSDDSSVTDAATDTSSGDDATADVVVEATIDAPADVGTKPPCTANPDKTGTTNRTVSGHPYVAYVPASYTPSSEVPLVVALHGAGDTALNYLSIVWKGNADANGFIVIAPEGSAPLGSGFTWNS